MKAILLMFDSLNCTDGRYVCMRAPVLPNNQPLFDLAQDPAQNQPIRDEAVERRMTRLMTDLMRANDAPSEQFERIGLS